ncbi:MAG: hypothetical protein ABSF26_00960 [Thermoguttaceae bacterium]
MSSNSTCGIRDAADTELTPEHYRRWGAKLGGWVEPGAKFLVAGDLRRSTPALQAALVEGLCAAGVDCIDLGELPTPMVHYARRRLRAAGSAVVTAAHHPAAVSGLTWTVGGPPTAEQAAQLRRAAGSGGHGDAETRRRGDAATGDAETRGRGDGEGSDLSASPRPRVSASSSSPPSAFPLPPSPFPLPPSAFRLPPSAFPPPPSALRPPTAPRTLDVSFDYVAWLQETWCDGLRAQLHVVLDAMHGCWSSRARRYLHAIFPACLVSVVREGSDPDFRGQPPDCSRPEELDLLCKAVYRQRAHLGIALHGDGERLALVDGRGVPLSAEETAWLLMRTMGRRLRGQSIVFDQAFSDRLPEAARRLGARPLVDGGCPAALQARMSASGAAFGAQARGHYFFAELDHGADALYTACRVIAHLDRSGESLAELRRRCPRVFMTPAIRLPIEPEAREQFFALVRGAWSEFPQSTIDGLRIDLPGGWALVRGRGRSALDFRFESLDWPALDDLVRQFSDSLPWLGPELWAGYEAAMGRT